MKLGEAVAKGWACKHVDGPVAGTYKVSKANYEAGYYKRFEPDDPRVRSPFNTSTYYCFEYPGANTLNDIASYAGEEGWE